MSEIAPAIYAPTGRDALDAWQSGKGAGSWVFLFESALPLLGYVQQNYPGARVIVREWIDGASPGWLNSGDPESAGYAYGQAFISRYPSAAGFQSTNEQEGATSHERLIAFDTGFLRACKERGKLALIGTYSDYWSGQWPPSSEVWSRWLALLSDPNAAQGLHVYWDQSGPPNTMYDFWTHLPPRWFVTECGIRGGWRNRVSEDELLRQLRVFASQYASGAQAIFPFITGDSGGWHDFDLAGTGIPAALGGGYAPAPSSPSDSGGVAAGAPPFRVAPAQPDSAADHSGPASGAGGDQNPQIASQGGEAMAEFVLGFKDLADRLGRTVVGEPETDEKTLHDHLPNGTVLNIATFQSTTKGIMFYQEGGSPKFLPSR